MADEKALREEYAYAEANWRNDDYGRGLTATLTCCVHCGRELDGGRVNPWLNQIECWHVGGLPACAPGQAWYTANIWVDSNGVRRHVDDTRGIQ